MCYFLKGISRPLWECKDIAYTYTRPKSPQKNPNPLKSKKPGKNPKQQEEKNPTKPAKTERKSYL